jgi:hypothetical protein
MATLQLLHKLKLIETKEKHDEPETDGHYHCKFRKKDNDYYIHIDRDSVICIGAVKLTREEAVQLAKDILNVAL